MNYEEKKTVKEILNRCIALMKLRELLNCNLITLEEYENLKKKSNFFKLVEKKESLCYNIFEIIITTTKGGINVSC